MSTYYEYQDVGVMMAHKLMAMDGWEVFGYHADNSDMMTDYYDPAYWGGIATKNGYTLVVNRSSEAKPEEIRKYNYDGTPQDRSISEKIAKLEQMTMERGASEQEEESAKKMIEKLRSKANETSEKYIVTGIIPGHMANPPRMNWHIEKDGVYVAKGNGILKFAHIDNYYRYESYMKDMQNFRTMKREEYRNSLISEYIGRWNDTEERAAEQADSHIESMEKDKALMDQFEAFINKIDTTCGGMLGGGDGVVYEKVKVTEYKKENKAVETENGCVKDGQCFILKSSFNYGRNKGYVYRIKATVYEDGKTSYHAYKLNGKLTKECTGNANQANHWFIGTMTDGFMKWINKGAIAWCEIQEVKTPYEVEKVVKKVINYKEDNNKDAGALKGSKAIIEKADGGILALPVIHKDLKKLKPILESDGSFGKLVPNMSYYIFKNRGGKWKTIIIWTKLNMGTMREVDCFVTDYNYELITDIEQTLIDFKLDDVGDVGIIETDVDVSGSDLATELSKVSK